MKKRLFYVAILLCLFSALVSPVVVEAAKPKLNKCKMTLTVGTKKKLKVKNAKKSATWKSSKKKVAVVNKAGVVVAKREGTAIIEATCGKKKFACKVRVKEDPRMNRRWHMCVGQKTKLEVYGTAKKIKWRTSDKKIVKVSQKGVVTGLKKGKATITATVGNKILKCKVRVHPAISKVDSAYKMGNCQYVEIGYYADHVYCSVEDNTVVKAFLVENGKDEDGVGYADLQIYGLKDGETTLTITNSCNSEKKVLKVQVKKPTTDSNKQRQIDYVITNGTADSLGDMFVTQNGATLSYSAFSDELDYSYKDSLGDESLVEWTIWEEVEQNDSNSLMCISIWLVKEKEEKHCTAVLDIEKYQGEDLVYQHGWYGENVSEEWQILSNSATKEAFAAFKEMLGTIYIR